MDEALRRKTQFCQTRTIGHAPFKHHQVVADQKNGVFPLPDCLQSQGKPQGSGAVGLARGINLMQPGLFQHRQSCRGVERLPAPDMVACGLENLLIAKALKGGRHTHLYLICSK
jgi:hypothetical protein